MLSEGNRSMSSAEGLEVLRSRFDHRRDEAARAEPSTARSARPLRSLAETRLGTIEIVAPLPKVDDASTQRDPMEGLEAARGIGIAVLLGSALWGMLGALAYAVIG